MSGTDSVSYGVLAHVQLLIGTSHLVDFGLLEDCDSGSNGLDQHLDPLSDSL